MLLSPYGIEKAKRMDHMAVRAWTRLGVLFAFIGLAMAGSLLVTPNAIASGQDGIPELHEFMFYYHSQRYGFGAQSDFRYGKSDLAGYTYLSCDQPSTPPCDGLGAAVKNNSGAVFNNDFYQARVYYNSGFGGVSDLIPPRYVKDLVATYNNNASFQWIGRP
jgi:hypothetical protein